MLSSMKTDLIITKIKTYNLFTKLWIKIKCKYYLKGKLGPFKFMIFMPKFLSIFLMMSKEKLWFDSLL